MGSPDPVVALLLDMDAAIREEKAGGRTVAVEVDEAFRLIRSLRDPLAERAGRDGTVSAVLGKPLRVNQTVQGFALIHDASDAAAQGPPARPEAMDGGAC